MQVDTPGSRQEKTVSGQRRCKHSLLLRGKSKLLGDELLCMAGLLLASAALPQQKRCERVFGDDRTAWILQDVLDVLRDKDQAEAIRTATQSR
jgi:hypothetical protein